MAGTAQQFAFAGKNERLLNARQREVLALVADGKTNAEIGEALGMTLDGAKWNVSEILTKLGFASREEAAEYWRWRSRPAARLGRLFASAATFRWLSSPLSKVIVLASVGAPLLLFALSRVGDDEETITVDYFFEGTYFERHEGANWMLDPLDEADQGTFKAWHQDAGHFRLETTTTKVTLTPAVTIAAADGTRIFTYNGQDNTLTSAVVPPGFFDRAGPPNVQGVGFSLAQGATSIDALVLRMNGASGSVQQWARVAGDDNLLGIPVAVVEFGPTWVNGEQETSGGTGRMWIEPGSMFVLKQTTEGNDGTTASESVVTRFARNEEAPADIFRVKPPSGAATATPYETPRRQDPASVQEFFERNRDGRGIPGFYVFAIPDGLQSTGGGYEPQNDGFQVITNKLGDPAGAATTVVEIEQRRRTGPLPPNVTLGTKLRIRGHSGYLFSRGEKVYFAWSDGNIAILLTASGLSEAEVRDMAEPLRPAAP
jgi:DNA-binding CsgD family transcriptional regulator